MTTTYLNNSFALSMTNMTKPAGIISIPLSPEAANAYLDSGFKSVIKYRSTADLVGAILGRDIEVPEEPENISLTAADKLIVAQYTGSRLKVGATELPENATLEFMLINAFELDESKKKIWKFWAGFGRMGELEGIFVATEEEVEGSYGQTVHFGEALGKHSDVSVKLEERNFTKVGAYPWFVAEFERRKLASGYNPLNYLNDEDWDDEPDEFETLEF